MRIGKKLKSIYARIFRKEICRDCKIKLDKKYGLKHRIKHKLTRKSKSHKKGKKLSPGIHWVKVGKRMRKVKVLSTGRWKFMKGSR